MKGEAGAPRKYNAITCGKCGKEIGMTYYSRHYRACRGTRT